MKVEFGGGRGGGGGCKSIAGGEGGRGRIVWEVNGKGRLKNGGRDLKGRLRPGGRRSRKSFLRAPGQKNATAVHSSSVVSPSPPST